MGKFKKVKIDYDNPAPLENDRIEYWANYPVTSTYAATTISQSIQLALKSMAQEILRRRCEDTKSNH